ncbi:protein SAND isoform X2 [Hydra vulgaris]|uniref:Vacuolar fusion protein MON1 homolog n=1 Tax=Hydra vulgaris TaxID=6087 RepID=A0ABM4D586_HYDVU
MALADNAVETSKELGVEDVLVGTEPGARNSNLFAADSFEDLSQEECTEFLPTCSSTSEMVHLENLKKRNQPNIDEENQTDIDKHQTGLEVETVDEARLKRAESVFEQGRQNSVEDMNNPQWKKHKKHIFILSEAGKPIYTRYGNEEELVTMMGLMQAIVSFVQDSNDNLRYIVAGEHKFVFLTRGPIILVAVCSSSDFHSQLVLQLTYVYHQVLSVLTFTQLTKIFEHRRNYDLRKLLSGTEKFIDNLLNMMTYDPSFLLQAVRCLPMSSAVRDTIGQALQFVKCKELVFAILVVGNQLVTMVRPKKFSLHPSDLHLVFNLVNASKAFHSAESWTPICLPRFDNSGYLYAHISYLNDDSPACLLLLSSDRNAFFPLSTCKAKIIERLEKYKCLESLSKAAKVDSYKIEQVGISELRHFVYKSRSTAQFTSPEIGHPYTSDLEQERLFSQYLHLHHRIHGSSRPAKILCVSLSTEMLLGWVTSGFELYAAFNPLTTKSTAINAVNRLLRWIKKEEEVLFIVNSYTY